MRWTKPKPAQSAKETKDEPQRPDTVLASSTDEEPQYPGLKVVIPTVFSICSSIFLCALDRTIIGVSIPAISNNFDSFDDISWYESAYLLTNCAFQLPMGKIYTFFSAKWTFIWTVVIFEIGSLICAAAPTSLVFIIGRAIAGIGSAGASTGAQVIFVDLLPLQKRPKYQGFLGATFGLASIAGPLLGGVFTSKVSWRWCFWINVPIGFVAIIGLVFVLPAKPPPRKHEGESLLQRVKQFDPVGTALLLPALIFLLLALQWGGSKYTWTSTQVLVLLVLGAMLIVAFGISQRFIGDNSTVPPRILKQRSIAAASVVSLGFGSVLTIVPFYLPIWFQAIKQMSAVSAGMKLLTYFLVTVAFVIASGIIVSKAGYYTPVLIVGTALMIVGCGLLTTLQVDSNIGEWIGYQVAIGVGTGLSLTQSIIAAQTVLSREDIPIGITIITFAQFAGGTIFISICQAILSNTLKTQLSTKIPGLDVARLSNSGATNLANIVSKDDLPVLLAAYNEAIDNVFYCALAASCLAFVASFFVEWKSVKKQAEVVEV